ncbi:MAG: class I SAM-dependent methyltransferase [Methanoregulaceae archaeon]|jgi:release factor glutamine methyltransferase|nr:class I SAM-dependent methyltransferase [Methanoregulaceae archaeon]
MKPDWNGIYDPEQVYCPEADTYLLLEAALKEIRPGDRVLEIGTGSGYIAAGLKELADIIATDINPHAVYAAKQKGVEVVRSDLANGLRGLFDLVIFNPPYLPTCDEEKIDDWLEYALDGGMDGRVVIERFAKEVGRVLAPKGRVLLLISSLTGIDAIFDIFEGAGYGVKIVERRQVFDEELVVIRCRGAHQSEKNMKII